MNAFVFVLPAAFLLLAGSLFAAYRKGFLALIGIIPVFAVMTYLTAPIHDSFVFLATSLIIGSCTGLLLCGKLSLQRFLIAASLLCAFVSYGDYVFISQVTHQDYLTQSKDQAIAFLGTSSLKDADKAVLKERMDQIIPLIKMILPFYYFLNGLFWASCSYMFFSLISRRRRDSKIAPITGIERFRVNDYLIFLLIASIAALLAAGPGRRLVYVLSLNTLLILSTLYVIQAMGVIKFFLVKKNLPLALLPSTVILVLLLGIEATVFVAMLLAGCGALDLWADFRKLNVPAKPAGDDTD